MKNTIDEITIRFNMKALVEILKVNTDKRKIEIKECYEDYGAGIWHETIVVQDEQGWSVQILTPHEVELAHTGMLRMEEAMTIINRVLAV